MEITTIYEKGDFIWFANSNNQYTVGKIVGITYWDETNGFTFEIEFIDNGNTRTKRIYEDDICPYDEKDMIIEKMFIDTKDKWLEVK